MRSLAGLALLGTVFAAISCSDYRESARTEPAEDWRHDRADYTIQMFRNTDPSIAEFFDNAHGYAVFPKITKGAAGIGAAHGDGGVVYEQGQVIGSAEVTQVTVGAQLGGQDYAEVVFFETPTALEVFKSNNLEFSANASAVAATAGGAASADYSEGVAVFTMPLGGLMFEASIGGQKFRFYPE